MKNVLAGLVLALLMFSGCEKETVSQLDLKGTLKGKMRTLDEFHYENNDNDSILVTLDDGDLQYSTYTDSLGYYCLNDIPSGTYNLILTKEGYGEKQYQGYQFVGGDNPDYFYYYMIEKSSSIITNISLEIVNENEIYLTADIEYNDRYDFYTYEYPEFVLFLNNHDKPAAKDYLQYKYLRFLGEKGTQFRNKIYYNEDWFPTGSEIFVIAHGCTDYSCDYFDILSGKLIFTSIGEGSNIAQITVP